MQTPPNNSPQKSQREPLRWLAIAALLLAFLSICCVAQAVTFLLAPRNRISDLDLRSKILVDYAPWGINIPLPGIAPEVPAAQAADRATATSLALLGTPTPVIVGSLPTVELPFVPPVDNAPLPTPDNPLDIPPTPTATSRAIAGGAATPTSAQVATRGAEATNTSVPPTEVPRANSPTATNRSQQPTRTATSQPTIANTSLPNSTSTPTKEPAPRPTATHTPRPNNTSTSAPTNTSIPKEQATPTNTQRPTDKPAKTSTPTITPKPPATNTPRPTATNTPQVPTATNTPRPTVTNTPRPTVTNTARPTATDTPTPTATDTPTPTATDTPTPTATDTPQPATDTPTPTVVPIDVVKTASVTSAQNNAAVTYRIRITNTTGIPVTITQIQDTFDFFFVSSCQSPSGGTCTVPIVGPGGTLSWDGSVTLADTQTMDLLIQGHFENAPVGTQVCNPSYTVRWDQGQPITHDSEACINILP